MVVEHQSSCTSTHISHLCQEVHYRMHTGFISLSLSLHIYIYIYISFDSIICLVELFVNETARQLGFSVLWISIYELTHVLNLSANSLWFRRFHFLFKDAPRVFLYFVKYFGDKYRVRGSRFGHMLVVPKMFQLQSIRNHYLPFWKN